MSETLKAWVHWRKKVKDLDEHDLQFVKDIGDVLSQVGTYKAETEKLRTELLESQAREIELREALKWVSDRISIDWKEPWAVGDMREIVARPLTAQWGRGKRDGY